MQLITSDELDEFLKRVGKIKGPQILSILGKTNKELADLLGSEIGRSTFKADMDSMEELIVKLFQEKISDEEMAQFRWLRDKRLPYIAKKIREYLKNVDYVKKVVVK